MIRYLRMENFRRHTSTELRFDDAGQIVLIAGRNGAGKTSIIEAIVYALYGETRHGNRWVERLVRRGAELEGMEVELEFDVADETYRIKRRRDNKISSAVLYANDVALTEGSREVSTEVSQILGMDARGFRVAVVAQQKELDGLASMRPADRAAMLSRLLRLDAVSTAHNAARSRLRAEREALRGLGSVPGVEAVEQEIAELELSVVALDAAIEAAQRSIDSLDADLASGAVTEAAYLAARTNAARAEANASAAEAECQRIADDLSRLVVPVLDVSDIDIESLTAAVSDYTERVARAEAARTMATQAASIRRELDAVIAAADRLRDTPEPDEAAASSALVVAMAAVDRTAAALLSLREHRAGLARALSSADADVERAASIQALCQACGQAVPESHRHAQHEDALARRDAIAGELAAADASVALAIEDAGRASAELDLARLVVEAQRDLSRDRAELAELDRRAATYQSQLARLDVEVPDLDSLYAERALAEAALVVARDRLDQFRLAELAAERRDNVRDNLAAARSRAELALEWVEQSRIDTMLEEAYQRLEASRTARAAEFEILSQLRDDRTRSLERAAGLRRDRTRTLAMVERRRELESAGHVASLAADVLERVSTTLNQQIRPQLEGGVAEILTRLSDGRFDAVRIDADYAISVRDDGQFRPLTEFSGGEVDLIALAVRLALSSVVAERHAAGGVGFLILDECFGSQDAARRASILTALRALRPVYGQILLISHVGGLEDAADLVVNVEVTPEGSLASVE